MPYSMSEPDKLPANVHKMPKKIQAQWCEVFNSALAKCKEEGGKDCESSAFAQANGVAKKAMEKKNAIVELWEAVKRLFEPHLEDDDEVERAIEDTGTWSGDAGAYSSAKEYCDASLINCNEGNSADWKKELCRLPVKPPGSSSYSKQGIHAAAVRFNQLKKPASVGASKWSAAVKAAAKKLVSLYNQMDEEPPKVLTNNARALSLRRLYWAVQDHLEELEAGDGYGYSLLDVYDDEGDLYALVTGEGKLFRSTLTVTGEEVAMGDLVQVMEAHPPVAEGGTSTQEEQRGLMVVRQADGKYRWFAQACTAVLNRVGEIDSTALFDNFIKRTRETGKYPTLQFFHLGEMTRLGVADWLAREGVVYMNSGLFDDTPEARAAAETLARDSGGYWGTSIRYTPVAEPKMVEVSSGVRIPVYTDGIHIETSILPEARAAAWFTAIGAEEVTRMNPVLKGELLKLLGGNQELADEWEKKLDGTNQRAAGEGMISREATPPEPPAAETPVAEVPVETQPAPAESQPVEQVREFVLDESALTAIAAKFMDLLAPLTARLDALDGTLTDLKKGKEEEVRAIGERLARLEQDEATAKKRFLEDTPVGVRIVAAHVPRVANAPAPTDAPVEPESNKVRQVLAERMAAARKS